MNEKEKIIELGRIEALSFLDAEQYKQLKLLSKDRDEYIRSRCARVLGKFVKSQSMRILISLAADTQADVRMQAYESLSAFMFPDAERLLKKAVKSEKDDMARSYAIISLARVSQREDIAKLISRIADNDKSPLCVISCRCAEYEIGDKIALDKLLIFLEHESYEVVCHAINMLEEIIDGGNRDKICRAVKSAADLSKDSAVREQAKRFIEDMQ